MAKFRKHEISKKETEELLLDFSIVLSQIKKPREAVQFIRDIMSESEARMLAKRLKIAELLLEGKSYHDISRALKVSTSTIARVNAWLQASGEGYRLLIDRYKKIHKPDSDKQANSYYRHFDIKRKYPMYFWPQLLLENVIKAANERQKNQIREAISQLEEKNDLFDRLNEILRKSNN